MKNKTMKAVRIAAIQYSKLIYINLKPTHFTYVNMHYLLAVEYMLLCIFLRYSSHIHNARRINF